MEKRDACHQAKCPSGFFDEENNCILHGNEHQQKSKADAFPFIKQFTNALATHLSGVDKIFGRESHTTQRLNFLLDEPSGTTSLDNNYETKLDSIVFPQFEEKNNENNYYHILYKLPGIHFNRCTFHKQGANSKIYARYSNCLHTCSWIVQTPEKSFRTHKKQSVYRNCEFLGDSVVNQASLPDTYECNGCFSDCTFKSDLHIEDFSATHTLFHEKPGSHQNIESLKIYRSKVILPLLLNHAHIRILHFYDCIFSSGVNFQKSRIGILQLEKSLFEDDFDFSHKARADHIYIKNCQFNGLFSMETSIIEKEGAQERTSEFSYVTFKGFVSFRDAKFEDGLNLERINPSQNINFLRAKINPEKTNRETFRIIKDSFDKQGNHIEANKYFALEMDKYYQEKKSEKKKKYGDLFILWLNKFISNFGQNWIRPIALSIFASVILCFINVGYEYNLLYYWGEPKWLTMPIHALNSVSKSFLPLRGFLLEGREFLHLLFTIIFSTLAWQTLVAIKRRSRR